MKRLLLLAAVLVCTPQTYFAQGEPARPNVLFVIVDDLDCRIGCYGDPVAKTPGMDRLASMGVRFDRAYCQFPLCNPTRASVLSGRYPTTTGVLDNHTWLVLEDGQQTLPRYFEGNGYAVAEFGKVYHGANRGFTTGEPVPKPTVYRRTGKTAPSGTPEDRVRQQAEEPDFWLKNHSPYRTPLLADPAQYARANVFGPLTDGDRGRDAKVADQAIDSMRKLATAGKPFFLAVGFYKPHVPLVAPKEYFDLYEVAEMRLPPDFDTEPRIIEGVPPDEFRQNIDLFAARSFTALEARQAMRAYYACISYTDAQVGRLLDTLRQLDLTGNTIVVLWGDHGWHLSEKGIWAKGTLFEVSARGPLIIADPRIPSAGQTSPRVVQYLDMYPTLVELCNLPAPAWLEGESLAPLLRDPGSQWDKPAYTVQTRNWFIGRTVRTERWRYTEWDEGRRGAALYDHESDPHEMHNLAKDPAQAETIRELSGLLRA
ncbi:MAG: sulfatase, partial [bacterium]|nr:sulfatase [bacterium]